MVEFILHNDFMQWHFMCQASCAFEIPFRGNRHTLARIHTYNMYKWLASGCHFFVPLLILHAPDALPLCFSLFWLFVSYDSAMMAAFVAYACECYKSKHSISLRVIVAPLSSVHTAAIHARIHSCVCVREKAKGRAKLAIR